MWIKFRNVINGLRIGIFIWIWPLMVFSASAQVADPIGASQRVQTTWPSVTFQISKAVRIDATHVLVAVKIASTAAESTLIGEPAADGAPTESTPASEIGKHLPSAFSLTSSVVMDPVSGKSFKASESLPQDPYFGMNRLIANLRPGGWLQMSLLLEVPPPPVLVTTEDPVQKVNILLPKAKQPIKDFVLPK